MAKLADDLDLGNAGIATILSLDNFRIELASSLAYKCLVKMPDCIQALKALGEENRLRIVSMLLERPHHVNEIASILGITQYNVSKHLRVLREAGLLETVKQGQQRLYGLLPELSEHLAENGNVLDLGCCTFNFDKIPAATKPSAEPGLVPVE